MATNHAKSTTVKGVASPVSTGGGGSDFEKLVGAYYLAAIATGTGARGCPDGQVQEVRFQRVYQGQPMDDLIVVVRSSSSFVSKVALQIKRDLVFGQESPLFDKVLRGCWDTFTSSQFNTEHDRFGVVLALYSRSIDEYYQSVLTWARCSATAADFFERIGTKGLSSQTQRSFVALIRHKIKSFLGNDAEDDQIWNFLRSMILLRFDFHNEGSADHAHILQLLTLTLPQGCATTAAGAFSALTESAAKAARTAGSLDREALSKELLGAGVTLVPRHDCSEDLGRLRRHAGFILDDISDRIGSVSLGRTGLIADIQQDLGAHPIIELVGPPGSGKSALLKALVQHREREGAVLVLSADRIVGPGWDGFAATLQLKRPLDELLVSIVASSRPVIFVDGVDRIVDNGQRLVINDLLRRIAEMPGNNAERRWTLVLTARQDNLDDLHSWLAWRSFGSPRQFEIPELTHEELGTIVDNIPRIRPLVASGEVRAMIKNPYMLRMLVDERIIPNMACPPPVATEIELSNAWWERVVGRDSALGRTRQLLLLDYARLAARQTGPWLLLHVNQADGLRSLEDDRILVREPGRDVLRFSHDILEDWVICRVLDQRLVDLPSFLMDLSQSFGLYRPLQLLACSLLERESTDSLWRQLLVAIESASGLQPRWRQAVLTAPLVSVRSNQLLSQVADFLLADEGKRLCDLLKIVGAVEVVPDQGIEPFLDRIVREGEDPSAVLMRFAVPRWRRWYPMARWLVERSDQIPKAARPTVTQFIETWQTLSSYDAPCRIEFGLLAMKWLGNKSYFNADEILVNHGQ